MLSRWEEYKRKNGVTPLDMLNPKTRYLDIENSTERFQICKQCPELISSTSQCKKCGCIMKLKTKLESAKCPIGKW